MIAHDGGIVLSADNKTPATTTAQLYFAARKSNRQKATIGESVNQAHVTKAALAALLLKSLRADDITDVAEL